MEIHIYKAECGDAFRFSFWGTDQKRHHLFIDGGYERTFRDIIANDLQRIAAMRETIDLWIVTHIHDDHIGGVVNYVNAIKKSLQKDIENLWWHNPPRLDKPQAASSSGVSAAASIKQGTDFTDYLKSISKLAPVDIVNDVKPLDIDKLKLTVLSPDRAKLRDLRKKYALPGIRLERNEYSDTDTAAYVKLRDYKTKAEEFKLKEWEEDDNKDNGSSIAVMMEVDQHRSLWLADSFSSVVAAKLIALGYSAQKPLKCDLVKVSHHGCDENNGDILYDMLECQHFIVSSDGQNKHALPNKKLLVRILENTNRDKRLTYHFYFTHDDPILRSIFDVDGPDIFLRLNFTMHFGGSGFNLA